MITIANWVANLFILGLGTLFLGMGLFLIILIVATVRESLHIRSKQ